nr:alpha-L-fucosidase [Clostridia bacterium]
MKHRFGMFIHWGIYAQTGWHEQYALRTKLPRAEYSRLASTFNPVDYDPDEWVKMAKAAGMEYICFTAKHHDGFCMWDTKYTDFNIMNTPYGKDVLKMLADACERHGMSLSIYYSNPDSHHPNGYNELSSHQVPPEEGDVPDNLLYREYVKNQIRELMTNYGRIYTLFWDIPPQIEDESLNDLVRELQPGIMINDRGYGKGDFSTPERHVPDGEKFTSETEACQSVGQQSWAYRSNEDYYTPKFIMQSMDKIMLMGGSYLLNVGPDARGRIPERSRRSLEIVGKWYNSVRESFDCETVPANDLFTKKPGGMYALRSGNTIYLHFTKDPEACGLNLYPFDKLPTSARLLNCGFDRELECELCMLPTNYPNSVLAPPVLHVKDVPFDELYGEVPVLKLEFDSLE